MPDGPTLHAIQDHEWSRLLDEEDIEAWYHVPGPLARFTEPGAFARPDNVDGASPGDGIWTRQSTVEAARKRKKWALRLIGHEYLHCLPDWTPTPEQLEIYSHPTKGGQAIRHAFRVKGAVNAFSRVFRWRNLPAKEWAAFLDWFASAAKVAGDQKPESAAGDGNQEVAAGGRP